MAFQVSPGVNTSEIDLTTVVPGISSIDAGFAGPFRWGPINEVTLIDSEDLLVQTFQKPEANTYLSFFTAANFLNYSNKLHVVRAANTSGAKNSASTPGGAILVANSSVYYNTLDEGGASVSDSKGDFMAKFAGELGNSLKVSICGPTRANLASGNTVVAGNSDITLTGTFTIHASNKGGTGTSTLAGPELRPGDFITCISPSPAAGNNFVVTAVSSNTGITVDSNPTSGAQITDGVFVRKKRSPFEEPAGNMKGTVAVTANVATVTATTATAGHQDTTAFNYQYGVGDIIKINGEERKVTAVTNSSSMTVNVGFTNTATAQTHSRTWEYAGLFDKEPVTTQKTADLGGLYDEIHIAVIDEDGEWTGTPNQGIELFTGLSVAKNARAEDGTKAYYVDAINRRSKYVWWADHNSMGDAYTSGTVTYTSAWGTAQGAVEYNSHGGTAPMISTSSLGGGVDGTDVSDGDKITALQKFRNTEETDIGLLMMGDASQTVALEGIAIAEQRKDCVVFISPEQADVVNNEGSEVSDILDFRTGLGTSSYAFLDSGYKYQYDRYNDTYRYIPLNGDIAGTCAAAEASRDAWFSPAGFSRGAIRNVVKLPFNPRQSQRDSLYKNGINPVVTFMGEGTILFGDKTLLAKPSAFDRINIRRLFIILEKAISRFARASLFEFNDAFTRGQFSGAVEPFLRSVQGRSGITDFVVVCDETNNTSDVIDRNEFVGDIYVKPNRAINFIQLNFVAVRSGVEFSEIIG